MQFVNDIATNKGFQLLVRPFMLILDWRGRATRREVLVTFGLLLAMLMWEGISLGPSKEPGGWWMWNFLLWLTVFLGTAVRRMHDITRHGWAVAVVLIPYVGWLVLLFFLFMPPENDGNPFGPDPRDYFDPPA